MDRAGDKLLVDFLSFLADYVPTFPDELVDYYAAAAGFQCSDVGVKRLLSVAAQKFVAEIASDAMQYCKMRQGVGGSSSGAKQQRKMVLSHDDLVSALKEYGVEMRRPEYFADTSSAGAAAGAAGNLAPSATAAAPPDQ
ncbi:transcription initiation factor TFIID subunit 10 [Selaginella moellendorffii]|uniref:transcription initiation factor TFIID subunit 10 n=1 Tax=Selaginella moellendorffii TaxID=88036 RepID=UPI000D1C3CE3|nr:transcription initiation factor TFIID subunit 10 [Selaginella moellendorffii]|eukprot:XP_002967988.2 transcription initiation factor TFIID subunit 10 [Selaginella moellendorffii]